MSEPIAEAVKIDHRLFKVPSSVTGFMAGYSDERDIKSGIPE